MERAGAASDGKRSRAIACLAGALVAGVPAAATAGEIEIFPGYPIDLPAWVPTRPGPAWSAMIGTGVLVSPEYEGGKDVRFSPVPLVDVRWRTGWQVVDEVSLTTTHGLGVNLLSYQGLRLGGGLSYNSGRDQDDADRLRGLGDIDGGLTAKAYIARAFGPILLDVTAEHFFAGSEGTTVSLRGAWGFALTPDYGVSLQGVAQWADARFMNAYFGVTSAQSAASGLPAYDTRAGLKSVEVSVSGSWALSKHWAFVQRIGVKQVVGDAADSPVVERATQPFGILGFTYKF